MTYHSPTDLTVAFLILEKGNTYGKASNTPSSYSFQQQQRSRGSVYSNRTQVFSKEATICPLYSQSIIRVYDQTRDLSIT
jgi:hypothetical protein